jgi:hypothetical protein
MLLANAAPRPDVLIYPTVPRPVTVLGRKNWALLGYNSDCTCAVERSCADSVLSSPGRFAIPMLLKLIVGLTKLATPRVNAVKTKPVENGALLEMSYAKILRKAIESVSYVFLELLLIYSIYRP